MANLKMFEQGLEQGLNAAESVSLSERINFLARVIAQAIKETRDSLVYSSNDRGTSNHF